MHVGGGRWTNPGDTDTAHSNHVTSSKQPDTLICHTTMRRNPINFLYNPGHMILWCVDVGPVANAREGSMQEHYWAKVTDTEQNVSESSP